jgi:hypothetical protein
LGGLPGRASRFRRFGLDLNLTFPATATSEAKQKEMSRVAAIINGFLYNEGGIDQYRMCEWGIMKRAVEAETIAPTDRSMPPPMITKVIPTTIRPRKAPWSTMFSRFCSVRKLSNTRAETATTSIRTTMAPRRWSVVNRRSRQARAVRSAARELSRFVEELYED